VSEIVPRAPARLVLESLLEIAARRPDRQAARLRADRATVLGELARLGGRPDFQAEIFYTQVDPREDGPGRLQPPPDDGDDVFGVLAGVSIPLWRTKVRAARDEAAAAVAGREHVQRALADRQERDLGDLVRRIPLEWQTLRLLEDVLRPQVEEALSSANVGYATGSLTVLDLLDAEHAVFSAQSAIVRATTDYLVSLARLEGALGAPVGVDAREEAAP
jgi:outer membrane protein TolC